MHYKKTLLLAAITVSLGTGTGAAEIVHQFSSPTFSGQGYSNHVLTVEQLEATRRKAMADTQRNAQDKAERDAKNTNLAKFLVNVESRIYAQLSKQLADAMFADSAATSGAIDFQGTAISWVKTGTDVTLTIIEVNGNRTDITVPIARFAF